MAVHKVTYYTPRGVYLDTLTRWFQMSYSRKENDYGSLIIDFPPEVDPRYFQIDGLLEVQRSLDGLRFQNDVQTMYFIRTVRNKYDEQGRRMIRVLAYDANHLIDRRIVAWGDGTAQSKVRDQCDHMINAIMRQNFGSTAGTGRDLSAFLVINRDNPRSPCPTIEMEFAYRKILPLLQEIAENSTNQGKYLAFDVIPITPGKFRFQIYNGSRGNNRSQSSKRPLRFSIENGSLSYASYARDHTEERNFIYAGGSGEKASKTVRTVSNAKAIAISPFNRMEDYISTGETDPDVIEEEARARLREAEAKKSINGHLQQHPNSMFGYDYGFGDIVTVTFGGHSFDVHLDTIEISVDESNKEDVSCFSRNLPDSDY